VDQGFFVVLGNFEVVRVEWVEEVVWAGKLSVVDTAGVDEDNLGKGVEL